MLWTTLKSFIRNAENWQFLQCHVEQLTSLYHTNVHFVRKASEKAFMTFSPWTWLNSESLSHQNSVEIHLLSCEDATCGKNNAGCYASFHFWWSSNISRHHLQHLYNFRWIIRCFPILGRWKSQRTSWPTRCSRFLQASPRMSWQWNAFWRSRFHRDR